MLLKNIEQVSLESSTLELPTNKSKSYVELKTERKLLT